MAIKELARARGYRSILVVPMLRDGAAIGTIGVTRREPGAFTETQIDLLRTFADQAVIAIENVRLFDDVQKRTEDLTESLEQQTATSEVLRVISSSPGELEPVFQAMLANATRICEAKFGSMLLAEGDVLRRVALHNAPQRFVEFHNGSPLGSAAKSTRYKTPASKRSSSFMFSTWRRWIRMTRSTNMRAPEPFSLCRCSRTMILSAPLASTARRCAPSPTSRSTWSELLRAGRHRHREHAAAQRAARIAGAANRHVGSAEGHFEFSWRARTRVSGDAGKCHADLRGEDRHPVGVRGWRLQGHFHARHLAGLRRIPQPWAVPTWPGNRLGPCRQRAADRPHRRYARRAGLRRPRPLPHRHRRARRSANASQRADVQGRKADRRHRHLPSGSASVHRQADRAGHELRRAGRHRHREHAAAQRAA